MLPNTETNLILDTDSYKVSHWLQFPPNTTGMFSYLESRGGRDPEVVFFGLQYLLKKYLTQRITPDMVKEADHFLARHGVPFNRAGWMRIAHELGGRLPVRIRAVPEGTVVPTHNVLMTVESTDPETFWIVSWLETLLMRVWYPCTVATNSRHMKQVIHRYLLETSDNPEAELPFKLHDFGSRGVSSQESAAIGGTAHLVNFQGSDTLAGVLCANTYYHHPMAAFSIPAAEHSTITAWGKEGELDAYANMLDRFAKPGAVLAVVSDSYDLWNALEHLWGEQLRDRVKASGATVVLRPDSGHPASVVLRALEVLEARFGAKVNTKGFKVLDGIRLIQGDGINRESLTEILEVATAHGYSATNLAFGMGGGLLQQLDRDTQKFAYKCSAVKVDGAWRDVYKDPATDPGKASKRGRLDLICSGGHFESLPYSGEAFSNTVLRTVFLDGEISIQCNLKDVRARSEIAICAGNNN